jgi:hypothetical protein
MREFRFPNMYKFMDDYEIGAEKFAKLEYHKWVDVWEKIVGENYE